VRFLRAADQLAELYIAENQLSSAIELCRRILAEDNCWERAYRYLMRVYHEFGDQGQVARTYQKCVRTLREELDVSPAEETVILYNQLTHQPI
jgi:DNA-binding SARP family transcriptional activator